MRYVIHAYPGRMWYVEGFLLPSMLAQEIPREDITIWNDTDGKGNLMQFYESLRECGKHEGGTWHLQDDIIISRDFAERTAAERDMVTCGFACAQFGPEMHRQGKQPALYMWYSFQCIYIPNELAKECADWFLDDAMYRTKYVIKISERKHDDWFFREFMLEKHKDMTVCNLMPNLVDHIDFLIGGTILNKKRLIPRTQAKFFRDRDLIEELEKAIAMNSGTE